MNPYSKAHFTANPRFSAGDWNESMESVGTPGFLYNLVTFYMHGTMYLVTDGDVNGTRTRSNPGEIFVTYILEPGLYILKSSLKLLSIVS